MFRSTPPLLILLLLIPLAQVGSAHPTFRTAGIVNAASFMPPEAAGGVIARGSIFTVFGANLGPFEGVQATEFPLSERLGGVSIEVFSEGLDPIPALPLFVSRGQINAVMPSNAPLGEVLVVVTFDDEDGGEGSSPVALRVVEAAFGIFTINSSGRGPAVASNFITSEQQPLNATTASLTPGQFVTLWGTGMGGIIGSDAQQPSEVGGVVDLGPAARIAVFVGGVASPQVIYAGRSAEFAGLDQVVFQVPDDAPLGCYTPVWVRVGDGLISNIASLSISPAGGACDDPLNPYLGPDVNAGAANAAIGYFSVSRIRADRTGSVVDTGFAGFQSLANRPWFFDRAMSLPAMGSCAVYMERDGAGGLVSGPPAAPLDAGPFLILDGPNGAREVPATSTGFYESLLATDVQPPLYLDPGDYSVQGRDAPDVAAFEGSFPVFAATMWSIAGGDTIDRTADLTVSWTPPNEPGWFRLMGVFSSTAATTNNAVATMLCTAPAEDGSLTVQADVLANLPTSVGSGALSSAWLYGGLSPLPTATRFEADGLDYGFAMSLVLDGRPVELR